MHFFVTFEHRQKISRCAFTSPGPSVWLWSHRMGGFWRLFTQVSEPMAISNITVRGARQHNLKNISVEIPRNAFTVITGLSGSGKSSLAFDTIYAEGQRR